MTNLSAPAAIAVNSAREIRIRNGCLVIGREELEDSVKLDHFRQGPMSANRILTLSLGGLGSPKMAKVRKKLRAARSILCIVLDFASIL
jgi:hypothetical protein